MKNKESTRYFSSEQENYIAKLLGGKRSPNSGAGDFIKGDIRIPEASTTIECKTLMKNQDSISFKKAWVDKSIEESRMNRSLNTIVAFNFGPDSKNFFVIDEKLATYLINKLKEDLSE